MSEALRFNEGKPMMAYFMRSFPRMAEAVARVKEMGAIKYNDGNWRLGNKPDDEYWNSLFRHLNYIFQGKDYDQDTGCLHLGHAVWNLCALLELNYPDMPVIDDEVFNERAMYWAEQKRLREQTEDVDEPEDDLAEDEDYEGNLRCPACDSTYICPFHDYGPEWKCSECGFCWPEDDGVTCPVCDSDEVFKQLDSEEEGAEEYWCECGNVFFVEDEPCDLDITPCPRPCELEKYPDCNDWERCAIERSQKYGEEKDITCPECGSYDCEDMIDGGTECFHCGEVFGVPISVDTGEGEVYIEEVVPPLDNVVFVIKDPPESESESENKFAKIIDGITRQASIEVAKTVDQVLNSILNGGNK